MPLLQREGLRADEEQTGVTPYPAMDSQHHPALVHMLHENQLAGSCLLARL